MRYFEHGDVEVETKDVKSNPPFKFHRGIIIVCKFGGKTGKLLESSDG